MTQLDVHELRRRAGSTFFETFEDMAEGALATDRDARIVWINRKYQRFLGIPADRDLVGRPIADVIPNSQIPYVLDTGRPILLDIMEYKHRWCIVSRFPLFGDDGAIVGAFGFVLYDNIDNVLPLFEKVRRLRAALAKAESNLKSERRSRYSFRQFIGTTPGALEIKRKARAAARSEVPVVLTGETGTGKEILAQSIHASSDRAAANFVAVNVAAIPESLLEAEFFGAAPGAYTGLGKNGRIGKMYLADGGTLFLDEVADMPVNLQTKLLRALQEREIEPLGGNVVTKIDLRLICATSRDLGQLVREGRFRADLYYRIATFPIHVPPLRERLNDIGAIAESIVEEIARRDGRGSINISADGLAYLKRHSWPGNVRELMNCLERALVESGWADLDVAQLKAALPDPALSEGSPNAEEGELPPLASAVAELEATLMRRALSMAGNDKSTAASLLKMPRSTFYAKLKAYDL